MKKVIFFSAFIALYLCSCKPASTKKQTKEETDTKTLSGWDAKMYLQDKEVFEASKTIQHFDSAKAKVYFVKTWNTPSFYAYNKAFDGSSWDGSMFLGTEVGDSVFFLERYEAYSKEYVQETKDSVTTVERFFPKNGVSSDPRATCWWLSSINDYEDVGTFLHHQFDSSAFPQYYSSIKKQILNTKGNTDKEKVIAFTAKTVPGSPLSWDAWKWPGYYQEGKEIQYLKSGVSLLNDPEKLTVEIPSK